MPARRSRCVLAQSLLGLVLASCMQCARPQTGGFTAQRDVTYGEAGGQRLLLDVYRPDGPAKVRPAIILVHGGGWVGGDKKDFGDMASGFARMGYVAFSVNYRLATATANKYPAQVDDVQRAVRWIRANARTYGVDPKRLGAVGASAGGHLVAMLGTCDTRDNSDRSLARYSSRVSCVVDLFGPTDFTREGDPAVTGGAAQLPEMLFGKTREAAPDLYRDGSPVAHVSRKAVPFAIFHGTDDPLVPLAQSQRLCGALKKAGVEATLFVMQGDGHGFQKKQNMDTFIAEMTAFLKRHLRPAG